MLIFLTTVLGLEGVIIKPMKLRCIISERELDQRASLSSNELAFPLGSVLVVPSKAAINCLQFFGLHFILFNFRL